MSLSEVKPFAVRFARNLVRQAMPNVDILTAPTAVCVMAVPFILPLSVADTGLLQDSVFSRKVLT